MRGHRRRCWRERSDGWQGGVIKSRQRLQVNQAAACLFQQQRRSFTVACCRVQCSTIARPTRGYRKEYKQRVATFLNLLRAWWLEKVGGQSWHLCRWWKKSVALEKAANVALCWQPPACIGALMDLEGGWKQGGLRGRSQNLTVGVPTNLGGLFVTSLFYSSSGENENENSCF